MRAGTHENKSRRASASLAKKPRTQALSWQ